MKDFYEVKQYDTPWWWVTRTSNKIIDIARCYTRKDAEKVAAALNRLESDATRGEQ